MVPALIRYSPLGGQSGLEDCLGPKSNLEEEKAAMDLPQKEGRGWASKPRPGEPCLRDPQQLFVF